MSILKADREATATYLAAAESYSVAQFYRRFRREHGEPPVQRRRRLLLERAAYELTRHDSPISEVALRANFTSFEGFSRAFRRAFGVSPINYRGLGATDFRLKPQQPVHFSPAVSSGAPWQGELTMTVLDRLIGSHLVNMQSILNGASQLSEDKLDRPIEGYFEPLSWMPPVQTLRGLLRVVCGAPPEAHTVLEFRRTLEAGMAGLTQEVAGLERDRMWDLTFVDGDCDPPHVFSHGGWIGHIVTGQIYRRVACVMALRQLGVADAEFAGPNEFDAAASRK